jgi:YebC/PmpR family DNA-binding regulatory protein
MSGHSKWSTIKHKKGKADAARGRLFTKLIKEITVSARMGGGDPTGNARLRKAIDTARANNMPGDNIERAIKKGTGELEGVVYEELHYEGYGPGGSAVLVLCVTDNKNRTHGEIRRIFEKHGGSLGSAGCVAWIFEKRGSMLVEPGEKGGDALMEAAIDAGAADVVEGTETYEIIAEPHEFDSVKEKVAAAGFKVVSGEVTMIPKNSVKIAGHEAEVAMRLVDLLDAHDDVQNVYANFDISDEDLAQLGEGA